MQKEIAMNHIYKPLVQAEKNLFGEFLCQFADQRALTEHVLAEILFFDPASVQLQAADLTARIARSIADRSELIPVMHNPHADNELCFESGENYARYHISTFGADANLCQLSRFTTMIDKPSNVRVIVEPADRRHIHEQIYRHTGTIMDSEQQYSLVHVWRKEQDPYCYSALWNTVLVPEPLNALWRLIMPVNRQCADVRATVRAIAYLLYAPDQQCASHPELFTAKDMDTLTPYLDLARQYIDEGKIRFVKNLKDSPDEQSLQADVSEMAAHQRLRSNAPDEDWVHSTLCGLNSGSFPPPSIFAKAEATAKICGLDSPMLFDITGLNEFEIATLKLRHPQVLFSKGTFSYGNCEYLMRTDLKARHKEKLLDWQIVTLI